MAELTIGILCFIFPGSVEGIISSYLTDNVIKKYREDADLQNLIDFIQQEFHCCGLSSRSFQDWSKNEYFNCTPPPQGENSEMRYVSHSMRLAANRFCLTHILALGFRNPSVERCGVPYSCCKNATDMSVRIFILFICYTDP